MIPQLTPPSSPKHEADRYGVDTDTAIDSTDRHTRSDAIHAGYPLDRQIGYLLRLANQRHLEIFNTAMPNLTPGQFAVLLRLDQEGDISQNELGRSIGFDAATTNGIIERLTRKKLIKTRSDTNDKRRLRISLTAAGRSAIAEALPIACDITRQTLCQLDDQEAMQLIQLLKKMHNP